MFIRKAFRKNKALAKATKAPTSAKAAKEAQCEALVAGNTIRYPQPEGNSLESSDVEYIEDDDIILKNDNAVKPKPAPTQVPSVPNPKAPKAKEIEDVLLSLSVAIPSGNNNLDLDDDSSYSRNGIVTKLPSYLVEKSGYHGYLKIESRPSMTASVSSEDHATQVTASMSEQTPSESGSTASPRHEMINNREKKILVNWVSQMEGNAALPDKQDQTTASCLLELGSLHLQCEQFEEAKAYFSRALAITEVIYQSTDLEVARALEMHGMAESACATSSADMSFLQSALASLDRAFLIRYEKLGQTHIDTVETLNKIARVQAKQRNYTDARNSYYEVLKLREAIFGRTHPSVALTAQALATIHSRLFQVKEATFYFQLALNVFEQSGLQRHSLAHAIRRDLNDLKLMKIRCEI